MSFDVILPFLKPIAHLIMDEDISEIMVNGTGDVFTECRGIIQAHPDIRLQQQTLLVAVKNIARKLGDDVGEDKPILTPACPTAPVSPPFSRHAQLAASPSQSVSFTTTAGRSPN